MLKKVLNVLSYITGSVTNIAIVAVSLVLVYMAVSHGFVYGKDVIADQDNTKRAPQDIVLTIPEGTGAKGIGDILEANDLTTNAWIFYLQARLNGTDKLFRSGEYLLNANMSINEIMDILQKGENVMLEDDLKVRIVEGLSNKQIAEYLEAEGFFTAEEFLAECANGDYSAYAFLADVPESRGEKRLEGYLFPDTYNLPPNPTPRDLITRMLNRFGDVMTSERLDIARDRGMTVDEIVIIASIIEKEIRVARERELCSAVIYNRLATNERLRMCSTILYALDKRKDRLFDSDLEVDSPYNTYIHDGLPVGPISNAGEASLVAALMPADVNYTHFVVRDDETGEHFFTADYNEFLWAKELYNQKY